MVRIYILCDKNSETCQSLFHVPNDGSSLWMFHMCLKSCVFYNKVTLCYVIGSLSFYSIAQFLLSLFYSQSSSTIFCQTVQNVVYCMYNLVLGHRLKEVVFRICLFAQLIPLVNCPSDSWCLKKPNLWPLLILPIMNTDSWLSSISSATI